MNRTGTTEKPNKKPARCILLGALLIAPAPRHLGRGTGRSRTRFGRRAAPRQPGASRSHACGKLASGLAAALRDRAEVSDAGAAARASKPPEELQEKLESMREGLPAFEWFPAAPPHLMPYLYSQDELGNTVARPGPLIDVFPPGTAGAGKQDLAVRTRPALLAGAGLYLLRHERRDAGRQRPGQLQPRPRGRSGRCSICVATAGTAGWISAQIEYQTALGGGQVSDRPATSVP